MVDAGNGSVNEPATYLSVVTLAGDETRVCTQGMHTVSDLRRFMALQQGLRLVDVKLVWAGFELQDADMLPSQVSEVVQLPNGELLHISDTIYLVKTSQEMSTHTHHKKHKHH